MESLFEILFRISISVSLFFALYWILLRKSTHFKANRYFLIFSLVFSIVVAIFPVQYEVLVENAAKTTNTDLAEVFKNTDGRAPFLFEESSSFSWQYAGLIVYFSGIAFFLLRLIIQTWKPLQIILKSKSRRIDNQLILENNQFSLPFSFFNRIFINPKYHKREELTDILAHEKVHIRERHWVDLLIIELLTVFLWFNPFIWLFEHAIKQNHEYLADEGVLTRGHSPVRYQALLINQLMGMQVIGLTHNLNFALGPTRLKMMTKQKTPKRKLIRMAWALPIVAMLLVAFAKPEYKYQQQEKSTDSEMKLYNPKTFKSSKELKVEGIILDENMEPLPGASVLLQGTTTGAVADKDGKFELEIPTNTEVALVVSFVGYKTVVNEVTFDEKKAKLNYKISMEKEVIAISNDFSEETPPPPPPPPVIEQKVDDSKEVFFIVEEMPHYPNGHYGLGKYVNAKQNDFKALLFFEGKKLEGKATIGFTVNTKGEVTNVQVLDKTTDIAAKVATQIVSGMEKWSPGKQRGKPVNVNFALPFEF
ncbi:carboxypeptidase-like regulatory domain-containing protein [Sunxiuqinia sp. A32]|uniref:carboxypeptidase-like regulatory domain-containing protein n=1 Tax=Sunxiuqinia sp. A32 TaxID=3461496 RepID=UPI0040466B61